MSGFEIAGVVLGSMPLIISALEFYYKGIVTAKRFWRYKKEFRVLIDQIDTERGIFINTLEQLLTGVVRVEHMSDFLSNPVGEVWRDASIEAKLKDRLRAAYQIYMKNINGMEMRSKEMREKLALNADGTVSAGSVLYRAFPWEMDDANTQLRCLAIFNPLIPLQSLRTYKCNSLSSVSRTRSSESTKDSNSASLHQNTWS
jgi:hypothetical protein